MYTVYVLQSERDGGYYIGQTNNLEKRLERHNAGFVRSTRLRVPFEVIYTEMFSSRIEAMKREKHLKSLKGGNVFSELISR